MEWCVIIITSALLLLLLLCHSCCEANPDTKKQIFITKWGGTYIWLCNTQPPQTLRRRSTDLTCGNDPLNEVRTIFVIFVRCKMLLRSLPSEQGENDGAAFAQRNDTNEWFKIAPRKICCTPSLCLSGHVISTYRGSFIYVCFLYLSFNISPIWNAREGPERLK